VNDEPGTLFAVGAVVFMMGGLGLVLFLLDTFQALAHPREADRRGHLPRRRDDRAGRDPRHQRH
jgi:hypothetical protein